jgi:agmatine deiminase
MTAIASRVDTTINFGLLDRPLPDWEKQCAILVDPAIWPRYTRSGGDLRSVYRELASTLREWGVEFEMLTRRDAPLDIWIRDWAFVEGIFFRYTPDYAKRLYGHAAVARARGALVRRLGMRCRALPVVLDGGNLIHNGTIAIVTEKVFRENPGLSRLEIERAIISLGFERVLFIPVEPGDEIGHSDGMCRFLKERVLMVNDYGITSLRSFGRQLRTVLRSAKMDIDLIGLPWFCRSGSCDRVPSAVGCYMNFMHLAQGIIIPTFGHRKDDKAREVIESLTKTSIATISATPLAKFGGVFNCISLSL